MNQLKLQRLRLSFVLLAAVFSLAATDHSAPLSSPPVAKKVPNVVEIHGRKLVDNYFWFA